MKQILAIALLFLTCPYAMAEALFEGAPPVPEGFENYKQAQAAVVMGKHKRVESKPPVPDTVTFHDDIEYATPDGVSLTLDLYVPKEAASPPPVLLFIHGGAWRSGKKESAAPYAVPLSASGYACATIQYRLLPEHTFPKAIQDVNTAIQWLRTHGEQYGFDGSRIATLGGSAGGHLAMLSGYGQDPALGDPDHPAGVKDRVEAVVNIYGVVDCTTPVAQASDRVQDFIGASYDDAAEQYALASPSFHLDKHDPPTLTLHGTIDELVPIQQADGLHEQLDALGIPNYYDRIEGWPHSMDVAQPIFDRCLYITQRFLEKHFPIQSNTVSLFDGKTLDGWQAKDMKYWSVRDGAITGESTPEYPCTMNQFMVWQGGEIGNFELKVKFRAKGNGCNSGLQFRSVFREDGLAVGYQADIYNSGPYLGGVCDEIHKRDGHELLTENGKITVIDSEGNRTATELPEKAVMRPEGEWNDYHIIAKDHHMTLAINGVICSELIDYEEGHYDLSGLLGLQLRSGDPMTVQFKDIYYTPLP